MKRLQVSKTKTLYANRTQRKAALKNRILSDSAKRKNPAKEFTKPMTGRSKYRLMSEDDSVRKAIMIGENNPYAHNMDSKMPHWVKKAKASKSSVGRKAKVLLGMMR